MQLGVSRGRYLEGDGRDGQETKQRPSFCSTCAIAYIYTFSLQYLHHRTSILNDFTTIEITTKDTFISSIATRAKFRRPPIADYVSDDVQNIHLSFTPTFALKASLKRSPPGCIRHRHENRDKE